MKGSLHTILLLATGALLGTIVSLSTTYVFAHGGDTGKVHVCVDDTTGAMRMVGENDNCPGGETNVDWDQDAVATIKEDTPPFFCAYHCWFNDITDEVKGKNFSHAYIKQLLLTGDISGTNFSYAHLSGTVNNADASETNFSNAVLGSMIFSESDLTNADFTNASISGVDFTGVTNMDTATFTGATWTNTICPDGTNSVDHSDTCVGNLTP